MIRRAEATICPSFRVFAEGATAVGLSGDGRVVVGAIVAEDSGSRPVRWVDGRLREVPGLPPGAAFGSAWSTSRDGSALAGILRFDAPSFDNATFHWEGGVTEIIQQGPFFPDLPIAMSGDGQVVVLEGEIGGGRWRVGGEIETWEVPGFLAIPLAISDAGDVIVGSSLFGFGGFTWVGDVTTMLPFPGVPPFAEGQGATGVSPDGAVVVGAAPICDPNCIPGKISGALWRDGVFERREFPVSSASWDGVFLAGSNASAGGALFWDATGTVALLEERLEGLGVRVEDPPRVVAEMSYDAHVLIGRVVDGRSYQAVLAPKLGLDLQPGRRWNRIDLARRRPVRVRVYGSGKADASDIDPEDLRFGPERVPPQSARRPRDYNRDGHLDRDFLFDPVAAGLALGDREACLAGVAAALPFRLCSRVRVTWGRGLGWGRLPGRRE